MEGAWKAPLDPMFKRMEFFKISFFKSVRAVKLWARVKRFSDDFCHWSSDCVSDWRSDNLLLDE